MNSNQTPVGFSTSNLVKRIIPGMPPIIAFFLPFFGVIDFGYFQQLLTENRLTWSLLAFIITSLLVGGFIDIMRSRFVPVPYLFRRMVYDTTNDEDCLAAIQRIALRISEWKRIGRIGHYYKEYVWDLNRMRFNWETTRYGEIKSSTQAPDAGFLEYYRRQMDFSPTFSDPHVLYLSLYTHLDGQMSSLTRKYQTSYNAAVNFRIGSITAIGILILHMIIGYMLMGNESQGDIALILISIISTTYVIIQMVVKAYTNIEAQYIVSLMVEYLMTERSR